MSDILFWVVGWFFTCCFKYNRDNEKQEEHIFVMFIVIFCLWPGVLGTELRRALDGRK